jgi:hypothetical protein
MKRIEFDWQYRHMPMMFTEQISLFWWYLWLCHMRTHIGTIMIPPYWLTRIICSPASLQGYKLLSIGQSILTNLEKLSIAQMKTLPTFWDA